MKDRREELILRLEGVIAEWEATLTTLRNIKNDLQGTDPEAWSAAADMIRRIG